MPISDRIESKFAPVIASEVPDASGSVTRAVSAARKEEKRASTSKLMNEDDEAVIPNTLTDRYPNIKFECAKSSEQVKNGKAENLVKSYKQYVKDVLYLKPNASLPEFTVLGLDLLCEEVTRVVNQRPIAYLGDQDLVICANNFLMAGFTDRVWGFEGELPTKYLQLQQYSLRRHSFPKLKSKKSESSMRSCAKKVLLHGPTSPPNESGMKLYLP